MTPEKIARINELAKKQKAGTLTDAEKEEQAALRLEYRQSVVGNLRPVSYTHLTLPTIA